MAVVLVGALNVSSISTAWLGEIASGKARVWDDAGHTGHRFGRGDEIGRFNLGSTVVLVLPPGQAVWRPDLSPGQAVRMGQALATLP